MTNKEYSDFLVKNVLHDYNYYFKKYPPRKLLNGEMVTRFAPSPTGFVHMGSLYTSFAAIRFARQTKGVVYLRIEDTDGKRNVINGVEGIISDFKSLGVMFDEGPGMGGEYGPYIQSERKDIYRAFVKKLIEEEKAYPCFMTEEEIETTREIQEKNKNRIGIYGTWAKYRDLSREEVINRITNGEKYIIRLKSIGNFQNKIILNDEIKGKIEMPENDLDVVLLKNDDLPTYHFAHAVDDYLMGTTHVIRGDEWISSYPIHEQLFNMLEFPMPRYAHIAPITIKEGNTVRKLSKRKDKEAAISYYNELGIPKEVIWLYLATISNFTFEEWYNSNPNKTINDYVFEFSKMPTGGTLFDIDKLTSISKIYFSSLTKEEIYDGLLEYLEKYDQPFCNIVKEETSYTKNILNIEREGIKPRKDITCYKGIKEIIWYMYDRLYQVNNYEFINVQNKEEINKIIDTYFEKYYDATNSQEEWFTKLKEMCDVLGYASNMKEYKNNPEKYKGNVADVATVIRVVITSKAQTPDLYQILQVLGLEKINFRIKYFKEKYENI